jgi:catechol 2,3-dioxygenase-like lactoylglutathione lyase family enzyme
MKIMRIDHVQLAMPSDGEAMARDFYSGILGMTELPKPTVLAMRGGAWFQAGNVQLHLGVEEDFRPAKKAHVALSITDASELRSKLANAGYPIREDSAIDGLKRFFTDDAFGNRIEFIDLESAGG